MEHLISNYINNLSIQDLDKFGRRNNIYLSNNELEYTYRFVKNNWKKLLNNYNNYDFSIHKKYYSEENYNKILELIDYYKKRFSIFLK